MPVQFLSSIPSGQEKKEGKARKPENARPHLASTLLPSLGLNAQHTIIYTQNNELYRNKKKLGGELLLAKKRRNLGQGAGISLVSRLSRSLVSLWHASPILPKLEFLSERKTVNTWGGGGVGGSCQSTTVPHYPNSPPPIAK